jgi:ATP-dependent helicase/nuclease subunit A
MNNEKILPELDADQRAAVTAVMNTVVTAGAGSGKTKVLASRYAWLVMDRGLPVDSILALTFTNKAAGEMYSRIYSMLLEHSDNEYSRRAAGDFYKASVYTLDSFCSGVARTAAARYGISPDFTIDNEGARFLAINEALPFVLENRCDPCLRMLMADKNIRTVAGEYFVNAVLNYSPVSRPLKPDDYKKIQGEKILGFWRRDVQRAEDIVAGIASELAGAGSSSASHAHFSAVINKPRPLPPDMVSLLKVQGFYSPDDKDPPKARALKKQCADYFDFLYSLVSLRRISANSKNMAAVREYHNELKDVLYENLESAASFILNADITASMFVLIDRFRSLFDLKKRTAGILTFSDVAHLAVDALSEHEDLRRVYKESVRALMVDEFQDNNRLQKELIFLIAEKPERKDKGVPRIEELCPDKMFFVGDEKQSIYRFRGADVSVFRGLANDLAEFSPQGSFHGSVNLSHNYRSRPALVAAFNSIFRDVFAPRTGADYEASYSEVSAPNEEAPEELPKAALHFCFIDKDEIDRDDPYAFSAVDTEAAFVAEKIRNMVQSGFKIFDRKKQLYRPCGYGDFAVLERTTAHQGSLEKNFRNFGVPYSAGDPAGLFSDAPIKDMFAFLRLLVYPDDTLSYGAVLRSPFTGLSDAAFLVCMLKYKDQVFGPVPDEELSAGDREAYKTAKDLYQSLLDSSKTLPITQLLTRLWYGEGYRYETIWSPVSQVYAELFDFFFELARRADERLDTLADFLDTVDEIIQNDDRIKDLAVPLEQKTGVQIMTIHKSKGLEFPVVFIYGASGRNRNNNNDGGIFFSEESGITLNLPQAEELPGGGGKNYFFRLHAEEEKAKEEAELRRLLYVAMTRAEDTLFVTASVPRNTKDGEKSAALEERLIELNKGERQRNSFFALLLPPLARALEAGSSLFTIEKIPVLSREEFKKKCGTALLSAELLSKSQSAEAACSLYEKAREIKVPDFFPVTIRAGDLRYTAEPDPQPEPAGPDDLDLILERSSLGAAEFGTIVHSFLEARLKNRTPHIPPAIEAALDEGAVKKIQAAAGEMARSFLDSGLGALSTAAAFRESEFPIMTVINSGGKNLYITGQIDLLFEADGVMYVVDFKTDRNKDEERHLAQLAVYERAVKDIYKKSVRCWLFYLRGAKAVELTGKIPLVDIEKLAALTRGA